MRAIVVESHGGPEVLRVADVPEQPVGAGEARVAVRSVGVNFRDVQQRRRPAAGVAPPFVPGSDFAGDVVEVGAGVDSVRVGDRVVGVTLHGAYAERVVSPAAMLVEIPEGAGYDTGAILPVAGLSAAVLVSMSGLGPGDTAVTYAAAGGLGCFLGGLLARAGARSIGLTSTPAKAEVARAAGHEEVVLYRDVDPVQAVRDLTGGAGAAVVFDSVAGPQFARSFRMLRNEGTVVLCGRAAGDPDLASIGDDFLASRRNLAVREFYLATYILDHLAEVPGRLQALAEDVRDGRLHVPVTGFALDEVARAHELMEAGSTVGKLVLHP